MRAAVIPTMGREDLVDCVKAIAPQVHLVVLVAHNCDLETTDTIQVIDYVSDPPNISEMWNLGLDLADYRGADWTAVLNDDAIVPPGWFDRIEGGLIETGALAGWAAGDHDDQLLYTKAEPTLRRMTGYAFVVSHEVRADEQFRWWYGDNDLEWTCRVGGGVVHVGGDVEHRYPNSTTIGELAKIAAEDKKRFVKKWGRLP